MLLLKKSKFAEADLILHGLLPSGERIHLIARSALKSRKRFGGGILEPTHYIEGIVRKGKSAESLHVLEDARLLENFAGLRLDYDRLNLALQLVEMIDRSSPGGELPGVFNLLGHALKALSSGQSVDRIEIQFALKLLRLHGVLESEPWMQAYLAKAFSDPSAETVEFAELSEMQKSSLRLRVKQYIMTADLS